MVRGVVACAAVSVAFSALGCGSTDELRACATGLEQLEQVSRTFESAVATDPNSTETICPLIEEVQDAYNDARQTCDAVGQLVPPVPDSVAEQEENLCKQYLSCSAAVSVAVGSREVFDTIIGDVDGATMPAAICPAIDTLELDISNAATECSEVDEVSVPTNLEDGLVDARNDSKCDEFFACTHHVSQLEDQLPLLEEALNVDPDNSSRVCAAYSPVNETLASAPADCVELDVEVPELEESLKQAAVDLCQGARCEGAIAELTNQLDKYRASSGTANATVVCGIISDLETHEAEAAKTCSLDGLPAPPLVEGEVAEKKTELACDELPLSPMKAFFVV